MLHGNKGEWSEIYTLIRLIADGEMLKGDHTLNPLPDESYKVISIERNEAATGITSYKVNKQTVEITNSTGSVSVERGIFEGKANELLDSIRKLSGAAEIPATEEFMKQIMAFSIKAKSQDKADIKVEIHDHRTSISHTRGFSIKSQLGSPSTLLNASQQTVFGYKLEGLNEQQARDINRIDSRGAIIDRVQRIARLDNVTIRPLGSTSETFSYNLQFTDDALPDVVSSLLWNFYLQNESKLEKLIAHISEQNVRSYDEEDATALYTEKTKRLLANVALGMQPATKWNGCYDANGGYLVVLKNGEIISYHIFDKHEFESYLLHNTKLETPSTSRYSIGSIFQAQGEFHINLGLQIRFCT